MTNNRKFYKVLKILFDKFVVKMSKRYFYTSDKEIREEIKRIIQNGATSLDSLEEKLKNRFGFQPGIIFTEGDAKKNNVFKEILNKNEAYTIINNFVYL